MSLPNNEVAHTYCSVSTKNFYVIPMGTEGFLCMVERWNLVESKRRITFGGGKVKGNEVEKGEDEKREVKAHGVCFPLGMVSLFSLNHYTVTPSTPCRPNGSGVSAFGRPLVQVCVAPHALTGLCAQVQSRSQIPIKRLFMFLQQPLVTFEHFGVIFCVCLPFMCGS